MPPTSRRIPTPIRRHRTLYLASAGLLAVALFSLFAGHLLASVGQNPSSADLICILGGDLGERSDKGLALYRRGFAPRLLFTGMLACTGREENCYDDPMVKKVLDAGVPRAAIFIDAASTTSWEDAHNTRRIMNAHNWKRVLVVSDPPHLRRLDWTWNKVFTGSGLEFSLIASEPAWWNPDRWWENPSSRTFVLSELRKNIYYRVRY